MFPFRENRPGQTRPTPSVLKPPAHGGMAEGLEVSGIYVEVRGRREVTRGKLWVQLRIDIKITELEKNVPLTRGW